MKFFDLDSPLMRILSKFADLMWLNILTMICCIPVVTVGASLTALHYMALKIVRDEECYITRGFFKSFKENFKQATIIWLIMLVLFLILGGDYYIIKNSDIEINNVLQTAIMAAGVVILFTFVCVFPFLAKFENTVMNTIKNAFFMSVLQFPKTILMIILYIAPPILAIFFMNIFPIVFLFGISGPAYLSARLYNKFFKKLEIKIEEANAPAEEEKADSEEDERIFKDELDETLVSTEDVK